MRLSEYKPSDNFRELFGEIPTRTFQGETFWEMRARRVSYLQHVRDWDPITFMDSAIFQNATDFYEAFGLSPTYFITPKRSGIHLSFKEVPGFDIWEDWNDVTTQSIIVVQAQAKMISHGIKPEILFPNPGLEKFYKERFED